VITSSFGERVNPVLNKWEFHDGIDIAANIGTEAVAMLSGVVAEVGTSPTFGNYLKYEAQKQGIAIMYAHLQKVQVKEGEEIKQGGVVALTGDTGLSTGPHLHVSIWEGGTLSDPMDAIDLPYSNDVVKEYASRGEGIE
jgi:murein DD-endopeptidase MepM/ murein hydrolase activator NlpD